MLELEQGRVDVIEGEVNAKGTLQLYNRTADLPELVYISFDIDGLEPGLCPNTGTPVPGGLTFNDKRLRGLAR